MKRLIALSVLAIVGLGVVAPAVSACDLPCVYVRNTDPWVYVEVCSPI